MLYVARGLVTSQYALFMQSLTLEGRHACYPDIGLSLCLAPTPRE